MCLFKFIPEQQSFVAYIIKPHLPGFPGGDLPVGGCWMARSFPVPPSYCGCRSPVARGEPDIFTLLWSFFFAFWPFERTLVCKLLRRLTWSTWRILPSVSLAALKFSKRMLDLIVTRPSTIRARPSRKDSELKWCGALQEFGNKWINKPNQKTRSFSNVHPTYWQNRGPPIHFACRFPVGPRETWHQTLHLLLLGPDRLWPAPQVNCPVGES